MDDLDRAQEYEELSLRVALSERKPVLRPCSFCFYCGEKVTASRLFCDGGDCAADWEKEQRMRQIIGKTKGHC